MDIVQLNKEVGGDILSPFYIFTGEEIGLQNVYINQIAQSHQVDRVENIAEIINNLVDNTTLIKKKVEKSKVYIVRDDAEFTKSEKNWKFIDNIKSGTTLILLMTNLDKKTKFYKEFKDQVIEFNKMTTEQLYQTVKFMITGTESAIKYFIESCNNDYSTILNNIDKFKRLYYFEMTRKVSDIVAPRENKGDVFELLDMIIQQDRQAIKELKCLLESDNNPLGILSLIHTRIHQCVLCEGYRDSRDIESATGIRSWIAKDILKKNKIEPAKLLTALRIINRTDLDIKTGVLDPNLALTLCVLNIIIL